MPPGSAEGVVWLCETTRVDNKRRVKITEARMSRLAEQKKLAKSALWQAKDAESYMEQCLQVDTLQQIVLCKKQRWNESIT